GRRSGAPHCGEILESRPARSGRHDHQRRSKPDVRDRALRDRGVHHPKSPLPPRRHRQLTRVDATANRYLRLSEAGHLPRAPAWSVARRATVWLLLGLVLLAELAWDYAGGR